MFANLVVKSKILELCAEPSLALTVFRLNPSALNHRHSTLGHESLNELNKLFMTRISARKDIMLTQTVLLDTFCIRFAVGAARTTEKHVADAFAIIYKEALDTMSVYTARAPINGTNGCAQTD